MDKNSNPQKSNDQRANVKNPNNDGFKKAQDNRANQQNPNHTKTNPLPEKGKDKS